MGGEGFRFSLRGKKKKTPREKTISNFETLSFFFDLIKITGKLSKVQFFPFHRKKTDPFFFYFFEGGFNPFQLFWGKKVIFRTGVYSRDAIGGHKKTDPQPFSLISHLFLILMGLLTQPRFFFVFQRIFFMGGGGDFGPLVTSSSWGGTTILSSFFLKKKKQVNFIL